jgi:hypothetical protein
MTSRPDASDLELQIMVLTVAVRTLLKKADISFREIESEWLNFLAAIPPQRGRLNERELAFCARMVASLGGVLASSGPAD